jgi:hypothetical protein
MAGKQFTQTYVVSLKKAYEDSDILLRDIADILSISFPNSPVTCGSDFVTINVKGWTRKPAIQGALRYLADLCLIGDFRIDLEQKADLERIFSKWTSGSSRNITSWINFVTRI